MSAKGMATPGGSGIGLIYGTFVFWAICAFRYETGFDWIVYEDYFSAVASSAFFEVPAGVVSMEPLYYLLNYSVSLFGDFQLLLIIIGTFNAVCAALFFKQLGIRVVFGLAFVFCWVYLPLEMGTIRQSISVSFALLAVIEISKGRRLAAIGWMLPAVGFHYSAVIYLVIFAKTILVYLLRNAYPLIAVCLLFYILAPSGIGQATIGYGSSLGIPFVSEKLAIYADFGGSGKTITGLGFLILNCVLLIVSRRQLDWKSERIQVVMSVALLLVLCQAFLFDFALIWNRVHYLAAFCQAVLLFHLLKTFRLPIRLPVFAGIVCLSFASIYILLRSESSIPFVPYQSYVVHKLTDEAGDGRLRANAYYELFEEKRAEAN
jgi:hypothetical protein